LGEIPKTTVQEERLSSAEDFSAFIRLYAEKHHLNWSDSYVDDLIALAGGYPLGTIDLIKSVMNK
jgi:hypothetical protein